MNKTELTNKYWKYYLLLEEKFLLTASYVEIDKRNYATFSVEYAYLLQSIGAELDCFFKVFCGFDTSSFKTIGNYASIILNQYPVIVDEKINLIERDIVLQPFEGWNIDRPAESLAWWDAYNSIKHNRFDNIDKANLKNVLYILAALFLLESKMIKDVATEMQIDLPDTVSGLYEIKGWSYRYYPIRNFFTLAEDMI